LTYGELRTAAERVAAGLHDRGVGEGTAFSWQLPTRVGTVVLSLALARLGAVQNPIIALYREREVGYLLRATTAEWFAVPSLWRGFHYEAMARQLLHASSHPFEILVVEDELPEGDPATLPPLSSDPDAVRWLYSTSGTTAVPKIVRHSDATLIAGGTGVAVAMDPEADDVACVPFPYAHIGGPDQLVMALQRGVPQVLIELFDLAVALPIMREHGVTFIGGSTAHYIAMLQEQRLHPGAPVLPSLRFMVAGGAPKPAELFWQANRELGIDLRHGYGSTECPMGTCGAVGDTDEQLANTDGAPVKDCEIRVVDGDGVPAATGVEGEIEVRGPMVCKGYTDPDLTRESFRPDGFFRTGDLGVLRPDGHLVVTGRTKELIIRKGENVSPREIEDVLASHPKVAAVAVIGLPDEQRGERVCAVVERSPGGDLLTFQEMQQTCRDAGLMVQKIPEQLEVVDALPRNPTMKILKQDLVERFRDEGHR
jgi:acyl-CoA synthetase (AMP-forming)/AMP-acid ligase II